MPAEHHFTFFTAKGRAPNGCYDHAGGARLDYEPVYLNLSANESKEEKHTKYNPNGRIPTLIDHKNNDFAICYVTEKYDPTRKISFEKFEDKMQLLYAIIRYQKEIIRVLGVLESVLSQHRWLVGEKYSAADVSFIKWNHAAFACLVKDYDGFDLEKDFPSVHRWHNEMLGRPAMSKVFAMWQGW
ncbi:glutathione S-transferase [Lentinus tigrinus ALCF2SS1-7]|uniref:glutathione S-transferase n=1 Tax=Lentinus tigrinus ALCF2SS1-7 TaxID=1328758 RepID=UPI001165F7AE|nr:glutathione S-transferase [Lentinus tigrinus ALCF2SS1-7]